MPMASRYDLTTNNDCIFSYTKPTVISIFEKKNVKKFRLSMDAQC